MRTMNGWSKPAKQGKEGNIGVKQSKRSRGDMFMTGNRGKRALVLYAVLVLVTVLGTTTVFASESSSGGDPLSVINNLSTFIFGLIRSIGMILLGFGIVQVGLSLKSHDPSQRANGFLTLAGGVIITFAKEILKLIMG